MGAQRKGYLREVGGKLRIRRVFDCESEGSNIAHLIPDRINDIFTGWGRQGWKNTRFYGKEDEVICIDLVSFL